VVDRDVVIAKVATIDRCLRRIAETRGERRAVLLPIEVEDNDVRIGCLVVVNAGRRAVRTVIAAIRWSRYPLP